MENGMPRFIPMRKDLLVRELNSEVILYDRRTRKAYCLNPAAAAVWRLCDGQKSVKEIARALEKDSAVPIDEAVVWLAVREFNRSGLLQNEIAPAVAGNQLSRRELVKRIGAVAALALPIATSIIVPTPAAALSPPHKPSRRSRRGN
jgi:hypothetical protein